MKCPWCHEECSKADGSCACTQPADEITWAVDTMVNVDEDLKSSNLTYPPKPCLPTDPQDRKDIPICTGVLDYFPLAIAYVAKVSKVGNNQHNPGQPLYWPKRKSQDHADCIPRHLIDRGTFDTDHIRHSGKLAWRALALLELELEASIEGGGDD